MDIDRLTEWRLTRRLLAGLAVVGVVVAALFWGVKSPVPSSAYLVVHNVLEVMAVAVAVMVFAVGWNVHRLQWQDGAYLLAIGFFGVGVLDFAHALSFVGMPEYFNPNSVDKSIEFWLAARYLAAGTLLTMALLPFRPAGDIGSAWFRSRLRRWGLFGLMVLVLAGLHVWFLGYSDSLPAMFVPGHGLTSFKVVAELGVILLLLTAAALLHRRLDQAHYLNVPMLLGSVLVMAMSEVYFTFYRGPTDVFNLLGHLFKVVSYWLLYQSVFVTTVTQPYRELSESKQHLQAVLDAVPDLMFAMDIHGRYLEVYARRSELLVAPRDALIGKTVHEVMPAAAANEVLAVLQQALAQGASYGRIIGLGLPDGTHWFELSATHKGFDTAHGDVFVVLSRDVTQRLRDQDALRKFSLAVEQNPNAIVITDTEARIEYVNQAFVRFTGYTPEEVRGCNPRMLASGKTPRDTYQQLWDRVTQGQSWRGEFINRRRNGEEYTESVLIFPIADVQGRHINYLAIKEDVTEQKRVSARIEQLANFDALTGLPNRVFFTSRFQQALGLTQRAHGQLALLHLDVDNFKHINESLGHKVGDELLMVMAKRLKGLLHAEDTVSRQSGDEFMIVLPLTDAPQATQMTKKILSVLEQPYLVGLHELVVTASVGLAMYPADGKDFDALAQCADAAMHSAKANGRNSFSFFAPDMQTSASRLLQLENGLRGALSQQHLEVYYQPQLRIHDGALVGVEALLRWKHPEWGYVSPADFIPVAESSGQIIGIGAWVLRTAALQARRWLDAGHQGLVVSVNLSMAQFRHEGLLPLVREVLQESGLPPGLLEFELTESVAMADPVRVVALIEELHQMGVALSIDDFGTGYSSLSYLKRLSVQKLKIDQSFVKNIVVDPEDESIVHAIISMAASLGVSTIAEGVENREQLAKLRSLGCDEVQGYLFSPALPAAALEERIAQGFLLPTA